MRINMKKRITYVFITVMMTVLLAGCGSSTSLKNGYYTAEMAEFSFGWKEYLIIQVKNDIIVSAEYNAKNESGFIKAWDNSYMKSMINEQGTYPNKYTREYIQQLLDGQADTRVDTISGASTSGGNFEKLVDAVLKQAAAGDSTIAIVE